jgi:hypothetical protein
VTGVSRHESLRVERNYRDPKRLCDQRIFRHQAQTVASCAGTCAGALLPLPHVQFWETENSGRLDRSHRGSHRRDIPCLVDASDVRTLNAFKTPPAWSTTWGVANRISPCLPAMSEMTINSDRSHDFRRNAEH